MRNLRNVFYLQGIAWMISGLISLSSPAFANAQSIRILALGDSLTEGYGVPLNQAYPALLQEKLRAKFSSYQSEIIVINAGIGGSTSASGPQRLRWHLRAQPDLIVLALGANDMLRGLPPKSTEENLRRTLKLAQEHQVPVLLAGMKVPPNYGKTYRNQFEAIYPRISKELNVPLIPFLLEGVAGVRELNQEDGIHPNEKGHEKISKLIEPQIERWILKRLTRETR